MLARPRIALLIRSLDYGGAEKQVTVLANGLARLGYVVSLLLFYGGGRLLDRVSAEVRVRSLEKRGRWDVLGFPKSLLRVLKEEHPDVLYAFMPVANLAACLGRRHAARVVWGVRNSYSAADLGQYHWFAGFTEWLEGRFSRWPDLIISNSEAGRRFAISRGFPNSDRFVVVPNGIDTEQFRPDAELRESVRQEWGVLANERLVGIVGRLDPMKDHANFLEAAAKLATEGEKIRFVSVGTGAEEYAAGLREKSERLGLKQKMIWAGPRSDLRGVHNALDLLVSSSAFGEGFSNVLGEAMACGVPCVATDVGDSREVLGEDGIVVPARDSSVLAAGVAHMLERRRLEGDCLGARLRKRVIENFSVDRLVERTSEALEMIA
jgi:glycosyltransferase involved in cell wall biosynthesis